MSDERGRVAARGWLTRAGRKLESVASEYKADATYLGEWQAEASAALAEFDRRMDAFDVAQAKMETTIEEERLLEEIEKVSIYKDSFSKIRAKVQVMLNISAVQLSRKTASSADNIKLPKLDLPLFAGKVENWPTFWEAFEACVMESNMPEVNQFA